jgi:hypothetical protein
LFKVQFAAMTSDQIDIAFQRWFGMATPAEVKRLNMVTPADFAVVSRKAKILRTADVETLTMMIAAEVALKPGARRAVGFI